MTRRSSSRWPRCGTRPAGSAQARVEGEPTEDLEKERARLERLVRAEHHRLAGADEEAERLDVDHLVRQVGDGTLVELVDVDGVLHVLVVHGGRVRRHVAGTTTDALALTESARFLLRRSARGRPYAPGDLGARLEQALLGDAARLLPEGPVVVVPTARLHGVPWALLPALADRAFGVVPSAAQWLRARDARPARNAGVALLAGPGLGTGGAEVPVLARRRPDAVHLAGDAAPRSRPPWRRSTAPGWRTSPRMAGSGRTARCSPRSSWPTGR